MSKWIRTCALGLLLLIAGLTLNVFTAPIASADCAVLYTPCGPPPPANLQAQAPNTGEIVLYWDSQPVIGNNPDPWVLTTFVEVYRGNDRIAKLDAGKEIIPTTYTDPNPPQSGEVAYKIRLLTGGDVAGRFGNEVKVTPVPKSEAQPAVAEAAEGAPAGTAITDPNLGEGAAPTAFEAYGGDSIGNFASTFASEDWLDAIKTWPVRVAWQIMIYLNYVALVFLAWSISPKMYSGIVAGVIALITSIFDLGIYDNLVQLASILGAIALVVLALKKQMRNVLRGIGFMFLGLAVNVVFTTHTTQVVTTIVTYPTQVTSYILGYGGDLANQLTFSKVGNGRLGLKIVPGYPGVNPAYDGVRMFQEAEFINTALAGKCRLNYGNLAWAVKWPVPVRADAPESFKSGMNYCEYLIKADHDHNEVEQQYLAKVVSQRAPPDVKAIFTGEDAGSQYGIVFMLTLAMFFRTLLLLLCGYVFTMSVLALGMMCVKGVFYILAWLIPLLEPFATRLAKQMGLKFVLSPLMAFSLVVGLLMSTIALTASATIGYEMAMLLQVVAGLTSLTLGWMIYKNQRDKVKQINSGVGHEFDRFRAPEPEADDIVPGSVQSDRSGSSYAPEISGAEAPEPPGGWGGSSSPSSPGGSRTQGVARTAAIALATGGTSAAVDVGMRAAGNYAGQKVSNTGQRIGNAAHAGIDVGREAWHRVDGYMADPSHEHRPFFMPDKQTTPEGQWSADEQAEFDRQWQDMLQDDERRRDEEEAAERNGYNPRPDPVFTY